MNVEVEFIPRDGGVAGRCTVGVTDAMLFVAKGLARIVPPKAQAARAAAAVPPMRRALPALQRLELPEGLRAFAKRIEPHD